MAVNFELMTDLQQVTRRDFPIVPVNLLNPLDANPLIDGEWLSLDSSYSLERGTDDGTVSEILVPSWPLFAERGRYDTQAIGKSPVLYLGMYEAQTRVVDSTSLGVGDRLIVKDITIDTLTRKGLAKAGTTGGHDHMIVGHVTRIIGAGASLRVRFVHFGYDLTKS